MIKFLQTTFVGFTAIALGLAAHSLYMVSIKQYGYRDIVPFAIFFGFCFVLGTIIQWSIKKLDK